MSHIATERLYLTEDGRVVPVGDSAARWLFAAEGAEISDVVAAKYGIGGESAPVEVKGGRPKGSRNKPKDSG